MLDYDFGELDAVVVFFADYVADGSLGPKTVASIETALAFHAKHPTTNFICVGGVRKDSHRYGAEEVCAALKAHNVPESQLYDERRSFSTEGNVSEALRIVRRNDWHRIGLLSSRLHLARICTLITEPDIVVFAIERKGSNDPRMLGLETGYELIAGLTKLILPQSVYHKLLARMRSRA